MLLLPEFLYSLASMFDRPPSSQRETGEEHVPDLKLEAKQSIKRT
jgi:hypothetical protein